MTKTSGPDAFQGQVSYFFIDVADTDGDFDKVTDMIAYHLDTKKCEVHEGTYNRSTGKTTFGKQARSFDKPEDLKLDGDEDGVADTDGRFLTCYDNRNGRYDFYAFPSKTILQSPTAGYSPDLNADGVQEDVIAPLAPDTGMNTFFAGSGLLKLYQTAKPTRVVQKDEMLVLYWAQPGKN